MQIIRYSKFYHSIELFINSAGCCCEMCEEDGDTITCTEKIIDPLPNCYDHTIYNLFNRVNLLILTETDDGITNSVNIILPDKNCTENLDSKLYTYNFY